MNLSYVINQLSNLCYRLKLYIMMMIMMNIDKFNCAYTLLTFIIIRIRFILRKKFRLLFFNNFTTLVLLI